MANQPDLTRRDFMKGSALAGARLLVPGAAEAAPVPDPAPRREGLENRTADSPAADSATIENEFVRIELSSKTGDITGLYNKRTGKQYIAARKWARAFRLNVPFPQRVTGYMSDYSANSLDSWKQAQCQITHDQNADRQIIKVRYAALESEAGTFPIEVNYSIRLPQGSDQATLQLEITNLSPHRIREAFFPWISGLGVIESHETDTFTTPNTIRPLTELSKRYRTRDNWEEYPYLLDVPRWPYGYGLTMPWMNHGGQREGLYLASLAREAIYHMLMIQNFGDEKQPIMAFAWAIPCYLGQGQSWRSPEFVLSLHGGDWHAAADKYRTSLAGWYQKPDTSHDFKKAFASFNQCFATRDFGEIANLAEDIHKYGLRHLVMWNFGDYYPNVTEEDDLSVDPPRLGLFTPQWGGLAKLRAANEKAHSLGVRTGIIFSQRVWNKDALTPDLRGLLEKWVVRRESGDPLAESWEHQHLGAAQWSYIQPFFGHLDYIMCDAVKDWQKFAIRNILGVLSQAGYSMMFYDEAVESVLCFNPAHNHADVSAPCTAAHGFLQSLKTAMRQSNPDAILIGEGCEVVASQVLDAGWVWRLPPNPEVFRYTLPWMILAAATDVDPAQANTNFVLGLHLAIMPKALDNGKKLSDFPEFAQHVAGLASLREKTERFWVDGTFQDDLGLRVTGGLGKAYTTPQELALMIANLSNQPAVVDFELDARRYAISSPSYSVISSKRPGASAEAAKAKNAIKATRHLSPYEVIAVVFKLGVKGQGQRKVPG